MHMRTLIFRTLYIIAFLGAYTSQVNAQISIDQFDTLNVMVYNLLNYGNNTTTGCTAENNNVANKRGWLTTIFNHLKPDLIGVNELGNNPILANSLVNNVFNNPQSHAPFAAVPWDQDNPSTGIVSLAFYNTNKLTLVENRVINTIVRFPRFYRFYYNDPALADGADTVFLSVVVTHNKAGNTASDRADRHVMAEAIMNFLDARGKSENRLIMGDFNVYSSTEESYQSFTNSRDGRTRFVDPINRPGTWSNQTAFADIHTQSTVSSSNGCLTGGGLNDRFDFILANNAIMADSFGLRYLQGTYKAVANDGQRFKKALNSAPTNTSVPENVLDALVRMSDHLPVVAKFGVKKITSVRTAKHTVHNYTASIWGNQLKIMAKETPPNRLAISNLQIRSIDGKLITGVKQAEQQTDEYFLATLPPMPCGIYLIYFSDRQGQPHFIRVVKN